MVVQQQPTYSLAGRCSSKNCIDSTKKPENADGGKNRNRACSLPMPKPIVSSLTAFWSASNTNQTISKHASLENMGQENETGGVMNCDDLQQLGAGRGGGWSTFTKWSIESIRSWGKDTLPFVNAPGSAPTATQLTATGSIRDKRQSVKRMKHSRLVQKNGDCNVSHMNVPKKERQYIRDIFTTLIDVKWRYILFVFASGFVSSWTFFAIVYYVICYVHGDLENYKNATWPACVKNVNDMTSVFLFSVESQHTIGYGNRYATTNCSAAITTLCVQSICGLLIQSFMAGLVFAKLARPKKRAETLIFSKNACISLRDGQLCFCFRVGDMRNTHLVESHIRLQMIKKRSTDEGEVLPLHQYDMDVGYDSGLDRIFLVWPITICHVIDSDSPLYDYAADDLATAQFEIIVILEGIVESTGMTAQARTSYLPSEIMWGHRFEKLITFQKQNGAYQIDYSRFHKTFSVNTPRVSAKELDLIKASGATLGPQYYQKSLFDDGCDSETYTPSYTRASSFGGDEEIGGVVCRSPKSSMDHSNHVVGNVVKSVDEQKKLLLSPNMAKMNSCGKQRKPSQISVNNSNWTLSSSSNSSFNDSAQKYATGSKLNDPPEIVVVAPSSPSPTVSHSPASVLRQHDIM